MSLLVVKFGGTSVGNMERVRRNAEAVVREIKKGNSVVVVVSAMGHTTDSLIKIYRMFSRRVDPERLDFIMALGERLSARIFAMALQELGVRSRPVDPLHEEWPVITDSRHGMANIDLEETERRVKRYIVPLVRDGVVPVICGFLGRDRRGKITTIGRRGKRHDGVRHRKMSAGRSRSDSDGCGWGHERGSEPCERDKACRRDNGGRDERSGEIRRAGYASQSDELQEPGDRS